MVRSPAGVVTGTAWDNLPQQLHVSQLPSGTLSLGPGQLAVIPVTFLPRYPDLDRDIFSDELSSPPPILSSAMRSDLMDLVGEDVGTSFNKRKRVYASRAFIPQRRSNLGSTPFSTGDEFSIKTTILIDSSRGLLRIPVVAGSIRDNPYMIPDVIRFHHTKPIPEVEEPSPSSGPSVSPPNASFDGPKVLHSVSFHHPRHDEISKRPTESPDIARDCYDIYMNNPSDAELEIVEVLVSRPDLMSVEFDPSRLLLPPTVEMMSSQPSHVIRKWTEQGYMYLPADSVDNYIASVCTAPNGVMEDAAAAANVADMSDWIDAGNLDRSLGFLQIRIDMDILFVSLERFLENKGKDSDGQNSRAATNLSSDVSEKSSLLLKALPERLDFRFISSKSLPITADISLHNKSPVAIRIMRVAVTIDGSNQRTTHGGVDYMGLHINATQSGNHDSMEIPATDFLEKVITVSCAVNSDPSSLPPLQTSFTFTGSIVIRGTMDTDLHYDEWKEETARDPYRDIHLTLEIPYKVTVMNGRLEVTFERSTHPYPQLYGAQGWDRYGLAVTTLFFPLNRYDSIEGSEAPLPTQRYLDSRSIIHDLRIMSNIKVPLTLDTAEILDGYGNKLEDQESPCSRFNVSFVKAFDAGRSYPNFENLGFLSLQYKFDLRKERQWKIAGHKDPETVLPTKCFLNVATSRAEMVIHQIPLIVFPAEVEILGAEKRNESSSTKATNRTGIAETSDVLVGCNAVFSWANSSSVGKAFLEMLAARHEIPAQNTWRLYLKVLRGLTSRRQDEGINGIKPILVKVGAIEHGKVSTAPLFLTNYNPVPMRISIDVGLVEGMAIELSRVGAHTRGSTIFEFLPSLDKEHLHAKDTVLTEGILEGHSVYGLRKFLLSNQYALKFAERFQLRDAIRMSKGAIEKYPMLESLYHWHSYARFHRDGSFDSPDFCRLAMNATPNQTLGSVPLMMSGDKKFVHPLSACPEIKASSSQLRTVMIPPGGVARFVITVEAPPAAYLQNDISQLLATGLVLSTSFGQVMPVIVSFEALQGQLVVVSSPLSVAGTNRSLAAPPGHHEPMLINVPLRLSWRPLTRSNGTKSWGSNLSLASGVGRDDSSGIPLQISSLFHRPVRLLAMESCNPWFQVSLKNTTDPIDITTQETTVIGEVRSAALCTSDEGGDPFFPSYYQCVLNLLANIHYTQPPGCGASTSRLSNASTQQNAAISNPRGLREITRAIKNARDHLRFVEHDSFSSASSGHLAMEHAFSLQPKGTVAIKSGRARSDGYIDMTSLTTYAEAWDALETASATGLTRLGSGLRATIAYDPNQSETSNTSGDAGARSIEMSMPGVTIQSTMSTPRLFAYVVGEDNTRKAPVLQFPATVVGSMVAMKISLRNPTPVPVRVRLAVASLPNDKDKSSGSQSLQDRFMQSLDPPHVQDGVGQSDEEKVRRQLWWEGGGAFFLADERGDMIRAHHNVSIRAGGALFSLVSPSLHAISAFVVGCGARCGMREDSQKNEDEFDMRHHSIIGASSAAATTLTGRYRSSLPQNNELSSDEAFINAGGNPIPGNAGPQAFAIPFSGLDEIILPPFGVGDIGPIFFRPPGRFRSLGCGLARASGARYWSDGSRENCETEDFSSMVFLENSLTGLERIELRGKGQVERLYFLDSPSDDGTGDIEMRSGRSMLVFSGSGESVGNTDVLPVTKEVLLHNGGDVALVVRSVYLSDTRRNPYDVFETNQSHQRLCQIGSFHLLDCWLTARPIFHGDGRFKENSGGAFELAPGESRSIVVQHVADCKTREAYISINADFAAKSYGDTPNSSFRSSNSRDAMMGSKRVEMVVGYVMDSSAFGECAPVTVIIEKSNASGRTTKRYMHATAVIPRTKKIARFIFDIIVLALSAIVAFGIVEHMVEKRRGKVGQVLPKSSSAGQADSRCTSDKKRPSHRSIWNATFRCLARGDPSSPELQTLGREQIRHVVAGRYRAKGGLPPVSLANTGFLVRERLGAGPPGGLGLQPSGRGGGSDRVRTLSDALFRAFSPEHPESVRCLIPAGLGWRVAFTRGIIDEKSIGASTVPRSTDKLSDSLGIVVEDPEISELVDESVTSSSQEQRSIAFVDSKGKRSDKRSPPRVERQESPLPVEKSLSHGTSDEERTSEEWITKGSKKHTDRPPKEPRRPEEERNGTTPASPTAPMEQLPHKSQTTRVHSPGSSSSINAPKQGALRDRKDLRAPGKVSNSADMETAVLSPSRRRHPVKKSSKLLRIVKPETLQSPTQKPAEAETSYDTKHLRDKGAKDKNGKNGRGLSKKKDEQPNANEGDAEPACQPDQPVIAPPPGLAPPPGFSQSIPASVFSPKDSDGTGVDSTSLGDMLTAALNSDMNLAHPNSVSPSMSFSRGESTRHMDIAFGSNLAETAGVGQVGEIENLSFHMLPSVSLPETHSPSKATKYVATPEAISVASDDHLLESLLLKQDGARIEFDVMDFLDSILDDVGSDDPHGGVATPSLVVGAADVPVTSNPWAPAKRLSRAAAYGINVDESEGVDDSSSTPFPLLTPSAILLAGQEDDGDDDDHVFSFYEQFTDDDES